MRKSETLLVVDKNGRWLIRVDAVMDPLCAIVDGLTLTGFKGEKHWYMTIDAAIEWHERERERDIKEGGAYDRRGEGEVLAALCQAKQKIAEGSVEVHG